MNTSVSYQLQYDKFGVKSKTKRRNMNTLCKRAIIMDQGQNNCSKPIPNKQIKHA